MASTCRSCGAPIIWARTHAGKSMPLDVEQVRGGNVILDGRQASVIQPDGRVAYRCHFETCPQARQHRRPRGWTEVDAAFARGDIYLDLGGPRPYHRWLAEGSIPIHNDTTVRPAWVMSMHTKGQVAAYWVLHGGMVTRWKPNSHPWPEMDAAVERIVRAKLGLKEKDPPKKELQPREQLGLPLE